MTPRVAASILLERNDLISSFPAFVRKVFGTVDPGSNYLHNWHIDAMCEYLAACERREIRRLIINVPPRYLKSITVSVSWPAWLLGHDPSAQIMAASYDEDLAFMHSMDCRFVIESPWYRALFPETRIGSDQNEKRKFQTTARGHRIATSVGQARIGEGGDYLIIDDAHNPRRAESKVSRDDTLNWFDRAYSTRLNDKRAGVIVLVMQRLHDRDLTGHLLEKGGWEHLKLPAEAVGRTVIDIGALHIEREDGALLHPEREGPDEIATAKRELGPYGYAGQYQQDPTPEGGEMFKLDDIRWYKLAAMPKHLRTYIASDWAVTEKGTGSGQPDYTVHVVAGVDPEDNLYVLDLYRQQVKTDAGVDAALDLIVKWKPLMWAVEKEQIVKAIGPFLAKRMRERQVYAYQKQLSGARDKVMKAQPIIGRVSMGRVYFPSDAGWTQGFVDELTRFPMGVHDDQVDALAMLGRIIDKMIQAQIPPEPKDPPGTVCETTFDEVLAAIDRDRLDDGLGKRI